jgi:glyoxylate/hydroxypyruvate reductase A
MGYGQIGKYLGQFLSERSHNVTAWCKHPKSSADRLLFSGVEELDEFLKNLDVLICALPLTSETSQILNTRLFNKLKTSCYLINIGRGGHLNDTDLLEALTSKQIRGACLDVVNSDSTLLSLSDSLKTELHLTITPHIAGFISAESQALEAITKILEIESGVTPQTLVNFNLKY